MTKKEARELIKDFKGRTAYFGENTEILGEDCTPTVKELFEMFRYRFGMGEAEAVCIIAALVLAGGTIKGTLEDIKN